MAGGRVVGPGVVDGGGVVGATPGKLNKGPPNETSELFEYIGAYKWYRNGKQYFVAGK